MYSSGPMKSFQTPMKQNIATTTIDALVSGMMMLKKMRTLPAPSMVAASSSSCGMPFMNWRSRKML